MIENAALQELIQRSAGLPHHGCEPAGSQDPRLLLIERIAKSEPFQKSGRLPPLIRYLAEHSLQHDKAGLTEQAIGRNVFHKPKDFNPAEDSSVRVYMRQLRLRLHEFYRSYGRDESMVVEVPKGGYALVFHTAAETAPIDGEREPVPERIAVTPAIPAPHRAKTLLPWLLFAVTFITALIGWYRLSLAGAANVVPWPLNEVIHSDRQTTIVLSDASYSLRRLGDKDFTLEDYIKRDYLKELADKHAGNGDGAVLHYLESAQITSMADAHAVGVIAGLAGPLWRNLNFRSAKELTSSMLSREDLIFVGAKTSNPWVELYEDQLNFPLLDNHSGGSRYVQNRSPLPGEQRVYTVSTVTGSSGEDYATISLLPRKGAQGALLLVQGIRLEGTEAAIRFLADPEQREELARRLRKANGGRLPKYWEVLLHAHSVAGSAVSIDCITVRPISY